VESGLNSVVARTIHPKVDCTAIWLINLFRQFQVPCTDISYQKFSRIVIVMMEDHGDVEASKHQRLCLRRAQRLSGQSLIYMIAIPERSYDPQAQHSVNSPLDSGNGLQESCLSDGTTLHPNPTNPARRPLSATQATLDDDLIARIAQGDRLAMQVLFGRYHVRVFRFGLRLVRDEQVAKDLISEVFFDVWRQAGKFEGRSAVSTWLLAITRFKAFSALRRQKDVEFDDEAANAIEDSSDDPEVAMQKKDTGDALRKCLTALTAEHREIIDLVYYHEKSVEEVAEIVGIPENTVKTRLFYARKKLAELLKAAGVERGWP
jgi:RNA polymerase sigma-70 factor (ECF subfamily)